MNSYKKINQEIKADEDLKQRTIQRMMGQKQRSRKKAALVMCGAATVLLICIIGIKEDRPMVSNVANPYVFDEYVISGKLEKKTGSATDIAGVMEDMGKQRKAYFEEILPSGDNLAVPKHIQWVKISYQE